MSLITAYEVLKYSTAGKDYPTGQFCEIIPQVEEEFARECLGQDLYDYLVEDMVAYPTTATEWEDCKTYDADDAVIRNGCLFVCLEDGTRVDPLNETGEWEAFERFTTAGANLLWTKYLRRILALKVFSQSRVDVTWRSGPGGVVIAMGDSAGFRAANAAELLRLKADDIAKIESTTKNMLVWLNLNATAQGLPIATACAGDKCQTRGKRVRRWAFSNPEPIYRYGAY